jgi:putative oxidoreductase
LFVGVFREAAVFEAFCKEKLAPLFLRLALGSVCVYHGYLKIRADGGTTWSPGLPTGWQLALAWGEFAGGLAILVGFRCRLAAAVVLAFMLGLIAWWQGWTVFQQPFRSLEQTFLLILIGFALLFLGAGELSVDGRSSGKGTMKPARR